jgi:hypothetical protein
VEGKHRKRKHELLERVDQLELENGQLRDGMEQVISNTKQTLVLNDQYHQDVRKAFFARHIKLAWHTAVTHGWCAVMRDLLVDIGFELGEPQLSATVTVEYQITAPIDWDVATQKGLDRSEWLARVLHVPSLMVKDEHAFPGQEIIADPAKVMVGDVVFEAPEVLSVDMYKRDQYVVSYQEADSDNPQ